MDYKKINKKLVFFIQKRVKKAGAKGVILGLSGGIDSALVLTLCKRALNENILALIMPTKSSNQANLKDAINLCESLKVDYKIIEIQGILDSFIKESQDLNKIRIGNYAARIRMSLLYDYSALKNYLVIGTSNKSELMLGYGTIYGDLACAFNPIGKLFKSEIYDFARFLKLPNEFIEKAPSADLWDGQSDEDDLGFSYASIDKGLKILLSKNKKGLKNIDKRLLNMLNSRIKANAFKLKTPLIAKI
ncbi:MULTISPECIES: NAD+ synthase [unclassified Campylobacter]|uniref:NAD+ synthase n=1 Tax=unclassified Campylobacter TaxID=2593542 RepID=UPI001237EE5E|nr:MULTISPECIES: NAD+ synthase [unclassified Campylobacter]KAA6224969.1 NAD+ synthase [Campylobacter sp. LR196d]KAA6225291.1 NAD+ synthase [Campylobacter sp. LR286c]KAA6225590.1 NAD+ synthase [Campylobacter sp. LR185c]KAA6230416.1 NAD+ synthase [Campylobacter sp. LR291e]KAA6230559.1 NAD+ synthase [Campylobacter sp. LR264d]